jgi:DNA excision repair protein ERCC-2
VAKEVFEKVAGSVLMSGTLDPPMTGDLLGVPSPIHATYPSPFDPARRPVFVVDDVTTLYAKRSPEMTQRISNHISRIGETVPGNLAVFFQSYKALTEAQSQLSTRKRIIAEAPSWTGRDRDRVLTALEQERNYGGAILMGVMGGSFGEGVDYQNNLLDAVIVVGLPYAPPTLLSKKTVEYFSNRFGSKKGRYYAYEAPALYRVRQAAGRCIRSESDRAVIFLLDERFGWKAKQIFGSITDKTTQPHHSSRNFFSQDHSLRE